MTVRGHLLRWGMLVFVLVAGIVAIEYGLRWRYQRIARSDRITSGLTVPDPGLGWKLSTGWRGTHEHHDFKAAYTINGAGFRGADIRFHADPARKIAVVGDSFTFGIGVNDDETFTHLLDRRSPQFERFYNFAVPGFSTDQEVLLVEREVLPFKPATVVVFVYLFNDLFDNQLSEALQVRHQKPMFTLVDGKLVMKSSTSGSARQDSGAPPTLLDMVLGRGDSSSAWQRLEGRSHLFRLLREAIAPGRLDGPAFESRQAYAFELFWALIDRLRESCERTGTRLTLALIGGRTFVESPSSLSALFQEAFRSRLASGAAARRIELIDVAEAMRVRFAETGARWFYENEGHLNADGHLVVAEIVDAASGGAALRHRDANREISGRRP